MDFYYQVGDEIKTVTVEPDGDRYRVTVGETTILVATRQPEHNRLDLELDGRRLRTYVAGEGQHRWVALAGSTWRLERSRGVGVPGGRGAGGQGGSGRLEATMPGLVLDVLVAEGDTVKRGDPLVLLEAMKMELRIAAPTPGRIRRISCAAGQVVERGQVLVEIEAVERGVDGE